MTANILVFDSGVGGLSVAEHIAKALPGHPMVYLMDRRDFPYGQLSDDYLCQRVLELCQRAIKQWPIELLVIACNTASTVALPALRQALNIPVVGVVPAVKVAASLAQTGAIGVLATPATVQRRYLDDLIADHAAGCPVYRLGSTELVQWAEQWVYEGKRCEQLVELLQPWITAHQIRHVVLGCTHFPLVRQQLLEHFPDIDWIDSGAAIGRRVASLLHNNTTETAAMLYISWDGPAPDYPALQRFLGAWQRPISCQPLEPDLYK